MDTTDSAIWFGLSLHLNDKKMYDSLVSLQPLLRALIMSLSWSGISQNNVRLCELMLSVDLDPVLSWATNNLIIFTPTAFIKQRKLKHLIGNSSKSYTSSKKSTTNAPLVRHITHSAIIQTHLLKMAETIHFAPISSTKFHYFEL